MMIRRRAEYTFKYNRKMGRHGWLRLTPAYSVRLVKEIIDNIPTDSIILDPFSGTATTGLVAAEHGLKAHCFDINPFLIWLGKTKCFQYSETDIRNLGPRIEGALAMARDFVEDTNWLPEIHNISRWWSSYTLRAISALRRALVEEFGELGENEVSSLVWIPFCRLVIETSSAAFNHVSMSFHDKVRTFDFADVQQLYVEICDAVLESAKQRLASPTEVHLRDARRSVSTEVEYSHIVTSPPYPNRISYIRELRPYMYWTKFLEAASEAGELDWRAIGGTWGIATSRLRDWEPDDVDLPMSIGRVVSEILETGEKNCLLMAKYVWKYFHDMHQHFQALRSHLRTGATLAYIVGNSNFYGVSVDTQLLLGDSLRSLGYSNIGYTVVRKRNSKRELFEYCVYGTWKGQNGFTPKFFKDRASDQGQLEFQMS